MSTQSPWDNAKANANPDCPKCHGTGTYMYDHNHGTICDLCCKHNMGYWQLLEHYGANNGKWCCRAGCSHIVDEKPPMTHAEWLASLQPGDRVTRWLAGTVPMNLKVTSIDELIHCGPWKFSRRNGGEIDEELSSDETMYASFIEPPKQEK